MAENPLEGFAMHQSLTAPQSKYLSLLHRPYRELPQSIAYILNSIKLSGRFPYLCSKSAFTAKFFAPRNFNH